MEFGYKTEFPAMQISKRRPHLPADWLFVLHGLQGEHKIRPCNPA